MNGIRLHVARAGRGAPLVCLHGFPDLWLSWARVAGLLADRATCILPDQRGYNLSDAPDAASAYAPEVLVADIAALIETLGSGPVALAGHDWGGLVAAWLSVARPDLVSRLILVNSAHPVALQRAIWEDPAQRAASSYIERIRNGAFEAMWQAAGPDGLWPQWIAPQIAAGRMTPDEGTLYRQAWASPVQWKSMTDWYRAAPFTLDPPPPGGDWTMGRDWRIAAPVLAVWGEDDRVFTAGVLDRLAGFTPDLRVARLPGVGHNPHREAPEATARAISDFLNGDI